MVARTAYDLRLTAPCFNLLACSRIMPVVILYGMEVKVDTDLALPLRLKLDMWQKILASSTHGRI